MCKVLTASLYEQQQIYNLLTPGRHCDQAGIQNSSFSDT